MHLFILRHGESVWNASRRIQGHADIGLSEIGREQARRAREAISRVPLSIAFTSDLRRSVETAELVLEGRAVEIVRTPDLREQGLGPLQGLTWSEAEQREPEVARSWVENPASFRPPGGESFDDVISRVGRFLEALASYADRSPALVVAHGGSIRAMLYLLLGLSPYDGPWLRTDNCGVTEIEIVKPRIRLHRLNETAHLAGLALESPVF